MDKEVTVDQALIRAQRTITYPSIAIPLVMIGLTLYVQKHFSLPGLFIPVGIIGGFCLTAAYRYIMITKWQIWAYTHVRNIHELRKRSIDAKLDDGLITDKTNPEVAQILKEKLKQPDVYTDDVSIPDETVFRFSKFNAIGILVISGLVLAGGVYYILKPNYYYGTLGLLLPLWFIYKYYKELKNNSPQIIINSKGIQTATTPFYPWEVIHNESVSIERKQGTTNSTSNDYLVYDYPGGHEKIDLGDLNTYEPEMAKLLRIYRGRYAHRNDLQKNIH